MKIRNVKGSSKISPKAPSGYTSWRNYWESIFGQTLEAGKKYQCPACKEWYTRDHFDGCHVQKVGSTDKKWYIIPLCDSCNHTKDEPDADADLLIDVPSNLTITYSE